MKSEGKDVSKERKIIKNFYKNTLVLTPIRISS